MDVAAAKLNELVQTPFDWWENDSAVCRWGKEGEEVNDQFE